MQPRFRAAVILALAGAGLATSERKAAASVAPGKGGKGLVSTGEPGNPFGWPEDAAGRSAAVYNAVLSGDGEFQWTTVTATAPGLVARVPVFADGLKVKGVRVNSDMRTQELIARFLGAYSTTPRVDDLILAQADTRILPQNQRWYDKSNGGDGTMGLTRRMFDYDALVNAAIEKAGGMKTLVDNAGKFWALDPNLFRQGTNPRTGLKWVDTAANYGWREPDGALLQPLGFAHNLQHADYSQVIRLVGPSIKVSSDGGENWQDVPTDVALTDSRYAGLVSYATLPAARHPGV